MKTKKLVLCAPLLFCCLPAFAYGQMRNVTTGDKYFMGILGGLFFALLAVVWVLEKIKKNRMMR
ncbi:MAG: hypothetical protein NTY45_12010 [Elusimicrobia bacterium]|nr:hypothetical protein [Elusimicrobiota bacterium]